MRIKLLLICLMPFAAQSNVISQNLNLNVQITPNTSGLTLLKSEIVDNDYRTLTFDRNLIKFKPIYYKIRTTSPTLVNDYSFHIAHNNLTCSRNQAGVTLANFNKQPILSIGSINVVNSKLTLNGPGHWSYFNTGVSGSNFNQYVSDVTLKIDFHAFTPSLINDDRWNCIGNIILLTSTTL